MHSIFKALLFICFVDGMEVDVEPEPSGGFKRGHDMMSDVDEVVGNRMPGFARGTSRPQGPVGSAVFEWAPQLVKQVLEADAGQFCANLASHATEGILMNTQYSGMGCAEMAMHMLSRAIDDALGLETRLTFWSAADIMKHCRKVLRFKLPTGSRLVMPQHVFGDLLFRLPEFARTRLFQIQLDTNREMQRRLSLGGDDDPRDISKNVGKEMMFTIIDFLQTLSWRGDREAFCFKCGQHCRLHGPSEQVLKHNRPLAPCWYSNR